MFVVAGILALCFLWIYRADIEEFTRLAWNRIAPEKGPEPATPERILDQEKKELERILERG